MGNKSFHLLDWTALTLHLRDIIEVVVSQAAIASTSKRHDNAPVCQLEIKKEGIRDTVRGK